MKRQRAVFRYFVRSAMMLGIYAPNIYADEPQQLPRVMVYGVHDAGTVPLDADAGTASRLGVPIKDVPASVEILTQETIRERGDRTAMEAVTKATGFTGGFTGGTPGQFSVRGFTNNGIAVLHNGVRTPGGTGMSSRIMDTANFDRIEVLRGPASVLYGEGAIGAVVNFITREPSRREAPAEVTYARGSFNSSRLYTGTGGPIGNGDVAYRMDVSVSDSGSNIRGNRNYMDRLTGSLLYTLAPRLNLSVELDHLRDKQMDSYWGTPLVNGKIDPSLRRVNYNNIDDNRFLSDTTWLRANLTWTPSPEWEVKNFSYLYDSYRDWRNVENFTYDSSTNTVTRSSWGDLDHRHGIAGNRIEALHKGKLGGMENRVSFGADINRTQFTSARNGFPTAAQVVDPYNPASSTFNTPINRSMARDVSIDQWSLFAENQLALTDSLKLVGGVRYDRFDVDWIYYDTAGAPHEAKTHKTTSYRAGLVHNMTPNLTLYGSYTTAIEPGGTLLLLNRNQSQLDLTKAKQWEAGLKQAFWSGRGEWTLAVYEIEKRNVFVPDPANPSDRIPVGKQSSTGIEVSLGLRPSTRWKIDANLAAVNARFDSFSEGNPPVLRDGNTPPFVPRTVANLGLRHVPIMNWELGVWVRRVSSVFTDNANTITLPAYTTLDLGVTHRQRKDLDFTFRIRNVTDELYAEWAYRSQQVTIAEPRTYEISVRAGF